MELEKTHYLIIALIAGLAVGLPVMTFVGYSAAGTQAANPITLVYSGSNTIDFSNISMANLWPSFPLG